jgi:uncharacterized protein involved in copper resistance
MNKFTSILTASAFALISVTANAHSEHCKDTDLSSVMKDMKSELKAYVDAFKENDQASMQQHAAKLLSNAKEAKQHIPLKLQDSEHQMAEHKGHMQEMAEMDHSAMHHGDINHGEMEGMDHQTHMAHMGYMKGMDELVLLFEKLQQVDNKKLVKGTLVEIKKHSKLSHKEYRMDCDK